MSKQQRIDDLETALQLAYSLISDVRDSLINLFTLKSGARAALISRLGVVHENIGDLLNPDPLTFQNAPGFVASYHGDEGVYISIREELGEGRYLCDLRIGDKYKTVIELTGEQLESFPCCGIGYARNTATYIITDEE